MPAIWSEAESLKWSMLSPAEEMHQLCVTVCHCVSLCVTVCHCVSLCVTVCHCVSLCVTVCKDVPLDVTVALSRHEVLGRGVQRHWKPHGLRCQM